MERQPRLSQRVKNIPDQRAGKQFDLGIAGPPGVSFVPACDLAQHAKGGRKQRRLPDTEQERVLGMLPAAKAILRETMNVMSTRLEEE